MTIRLAEQLACGDDGTAGEPRLVRDRGGLRLRVPGDKRLARWTHERHVDDPAFEAAFGCPLVSAD